MTHRATIEPGLRVTGASPLLAGIALTARWSTQSLHPRNKMSQKIIIEARVR